MKRINAKPIGHFVSIAEYTDEQRELAASGYEGRMIQHPNLEDPRWAQVGDAIYQREDGSFFLHRLIMDPTAITSGEVAGNVKVDISRKQALVWWLDHYVPPEIRKLL
jgi:hypothetical protein